MRVPSLIIPDGHIALFQLKKGRKWHVAYREGPHAVCACPRVEFTERSFSHCVPYGDIDAFLEYHEICACCGITAKSFALQVDLEHPGRASCPVCDSDFADPRALYEHMGRLHSGLEEEIISAYVYHRTCSKYAACESTVSINHEIQDRKKYFVQIADSGDSVGGLARLVCMHRYRPSVYARTCRSGEQHGYMITGRHLKDLMESNLIKPLWFMTTHTDEYTPDVTGPVMAVYVRQHCTAVTIRSWDGAMKPEFFENAVIEHVLPAIPPDWDIVVDVPHGRARSPVINGKTLHIHVWSSAPVPGCIDDFGQTLWGLNGYCHDRLGHGEWEGGDPIFSPEDVLVASGDERNLYIYFDAVHNDNDNCCTIVEHILKGYADILRGTGVDGDDVSRRKYIDLCRGRSEAEAKRLKTAMQKHHDEAESYRKSFIDALRNESLCQKQLEVIRQAGDDADKISKEFDNLLDVAHIKKVVVRGQTIKLYTDTIYCVDPRDDKEYEIGEFELQIRARQGDVRMFNKTRLVDGYNVRMNAPHVFPSGEPCLGSLKHTLPELIAMHDYPAVAMLCVQYLESVNPSDAAGKYINRWPRSKRTTETSKAVAK